MIERLYKRLKEQDEYSPEDAYKLSRSEVASLVSAMDSIVDTTQSLQNFIRRRKGQIMELISQIEVVGSALSDKEIYDRNLAKLKDINDKLEGYLDKTTPEFMSYLDGIKDMLEVEGIFDNLGEHYDG